MATPKVVLSAAHTSLSPGAIYKDLREFDLTRKILEKTVKHLTDLKVEHKAAPVDLNLLQRIDWINDTGFKEENGDIFIELHVNDGGKRGVETWFTSSAGENNSENLGKAIAEELCKKTSYENQGVKSEYDHELKSLLILNQTNPIAIAIELLYIDNDEDYAILKDDAKLDEMCKHLAESIKKYVDAPPKLLPKKPEKQSSFGGGDFKNPMGTPSFGAGAGSTSFGAGKDPLGVDLKPSSGSSNITMDREQRKKMIEKNYKKYLGKEPKQTDLNYYLNTGISEDDLLKKIIQSKDHEELVKDAKDAVELREKSKKMESEEIKFKAQVADQQKMLDSLNQLLQHKQGQIMQMQQELVARGVLKPGQYFDPNRP